MKTWIFIFWGLLGTTGLMAQDNPPAVNTSTPTNVGPGNPIPQNSAPLNPPDPGVVFQKAADFANTIKTPAMDLVALLWVISLLYASWLTQISGPVRLVETFIRIMVTLALMNNFTDFSAAILNSIHQLGTMIPDSSGFAVTTAGLTGSAAAALMTGGVSVVATLIGITLGVLMIIIAWGAQVLIKGLLIAIAPLAIACIAFRHTSGIFTAWLKTYIAVCLIPLGWKIGATLANSVMSVDSTTGNTWGQIGTALGSAIIILPIAFGVFLGTPAMILTIVNKAGGASGVGFPSPIQHVAELAGAMVGLRAVGTAAGGVGAALAARFGGASKESGSETGSPPPGSRGSTVYEQTFGQNASKGDEMRERILRAAAIHKQKQA